MQSELHDRLEYLVNYSSQLIFVSGDSVAQQKRTLESFVFRQHDDTEIAYLTADSSMELSDYRRQLCRQLLGTLVGSYVRPLNELLAGLNEHVGPILITITQAEHMPDVLLQELWDLVLQSRFAGNKQHLNVLLFGETVWAEKAKQWLPAKNTDTPLLISSQSVTAAPPKSELDTMIENRRKAFQEHLAKRYGGSTEPSVSKPNTLRSPILITGVVMLFLVVFAGIIGWQYREDVEAIFAPLEQVTSNTPTVQPGSAFSQLEDVQPVPTQEESVKDDGELPITSWDTAVAAIDKKRTETTDDQASQEPEDLLTFIEDVTDTQQADTQIEDEATDIEPSALSQAVETLPSSSTAPDNQTTQSDVTVVPNPSEPALNPPTAVADSTKPTPSAAQKDHDNDLLLKTLNQNDYLIQLSGLQDEKLMEAFIKDNNLNNRVWVYRTRRYGGDWFVVIANQQYDSFSAASNSIDRLPDFQGKKGAFVKRGSQILQEINQAEVR